MHCFLIGPTPGPPLVTICMGCLSPFSFDAVCMFFWLVQQSGHRLRAICLCCFCFCRFQPICIVFYWLLNQATTRREMHYFLLLLHQFVARFSNLTTTSCHTTVFGYHLCFQCHTHFFRWVLACWIYCLIDRLIRWSQQIINSSRQISLAFDLSK